MMLYPAMNKLTSVVPNRYMLVNVVARRARQIAETAEETGERLTEKPVTIAINEVASGQIGVARQESDQQAGAGRLEQVFTNKVL